MPSRKHALRCSKNIKKHSMSKHYKSFMKESCDNFTIEFEWEEREFD
jgi:hypothetical protein